LTTLLKDVNAFERRICLDTSREPNPNSQIIFQKQPKGLFLNYKFKYSSPPKTSTLPASNTPQDAHHSPPPLRPRQMLGRKRSLRLIQAHSSNSDYEIFDINDRLQKANSSLTFYSLLNATQEATTAELQKAFRKMCWCLI
jgi:hypothetical protein